MEFNTRPIFFRGVVFGAVIACVGLALSGCASRSGPSLDDAGIAVVDQHPGLRSGSSLDEAVKAATSYSIWTIEAEELVRYLAQADVVADATLDAVTTDRGADNMDGTMFWTVRSCHKGPCSVGQKFRTRHVAPFSTSGEFCSAFRGCDGRASLSDFVGETFLASFSRYPYEEQVQGVGGVTLEGMTSLNRGYYLVRDGSLMHNDPHRPVDALRDDVLRQLRDPEQ